MGKYQMADHYKWHLYDREKEVEKFVKKEKKMKQNQKKLRKELNSKDSENLDLEMTNVEIKKELEELKKQQSEIMNILDISVENRSFANVLSAIEDLNQSQGRRKLRKSGRAIT
jgi:uncharacterized protein YhaN